MNLVLVRCQVFIGQDLITLIFILHDLICTIISSLVLSLRTAHVDELTYLGYPISTNPLLTLALGIGH